MNLTATLRVALRALTVNRLRTGLTVLGIVIGVGAVVALMSVGKGTQARVTAEIEGLGTNLVFVRPGSATVGGVQTGAGSATTLTQRRRNLTTRTSVLSGSRSTLGLSLRLAG